MLLRYDDIVLMFYEITVPFQIIVFKELIPTTKISNYEGFCFTNVFSDVINNCTSQVRD